MAAQDRSIWKLLTILAAGSEMHDANTTDNNKNTYNASVSTKY